MNISSDQTYNTKYLYPYPFRVECVQSNQHVSQVFNIFCMFTGRSRIVKLYNLRTIATYEINAKYDSQWASSDTTSISEARIR